MKLHENGYSPVMQNRQVSDGPTAAQASRSAAAVVGVVALVLALLVVGVYAVVFVDLMPQMR